MRILIVTALVICQFTAFPFISVMAANTLRHDIGIVQASTQNVTTVYKTAAM
jgi:hypothetical protein